MENGCAPVLPLAEGGPHDIRWCREGELEAIQSRPPDAILWYCRAALREVV